MNPIRPWTVRQRKHIQCFRIFDIYEDLSVSPTTGKEHSFYVIHGVHWVNVIPITPERQVVLVEQYRHGIRSVSLEIPGGMMDESDHDPAAAGRRELAEETGYDSDDVSIIGRAHPNPAIQDNTCYVVLVKNARLCAPTRFDATEEIALRLVDLEKIPRMIREGEITHSLVINAFYWLELGLKQGSITLY